MKELQIKDICEKGSSNLKQKDVEGKDGLYPVYGASGIISHIDTYHQEKNYIAIVKDGSGIGRVSFMPAKSSVIGTMQYILPKEDFDINYIGYCLQSLDLSKYKQGAAIPHIYFRDYGERIVKVSDDLKEQQSIVDYLDSAFGKIDAMKSNAEKALNEAKALFQASLKEMLEPKDGWEEKILGDIAVDSADGPFGSNLKKEHYTTNKEVRIIQLSNIGEDGWREENTKYTTFEHLKNISRSEVEPNDIVIAKMMPAGRAILCPAHEKKFVLSSDAVKIKLKKGLNTRFILHSINSPYFRKEVYENVTGSGRVRTSLTKLRACNIYLPSIAEQQSIVETLDTLKSKVDRLQENYDKISQECDALKQAILRQVFE